MNIISLNFNDIVTSNNKENANSSTIFKVGEQISGIYKEQGYSKYLEIDGNTLSLSNDANIVAKNGDKVTFDVIKNEKGTISLKQVFPQAVASNKKANEKKTIHDALFEYLDFEKEEKNVKDMITNRVKEHKEKTAEINRIKSLIKYSVNNISQNVYTRLAGLGLSADKVGVQTLAGIVYEVSNYENKSLKNAFTAENISTHANREALILTSLTESGLPISDDNVNKLRNLLSTSNEVFPVTDDEAISFLKNFEDYNLENLYKAKHTTDDLKHSNSFLENENIFDSFLNREGIEKTETNINILKTFFVNGIDITKENFDIYKALTQADKLPEQFLLEAGIANMKESTPIMQIPIWSVLNKESLYSKYEDIKDTLSKIENTDIYKHSSYKTLEEMSAIYNQHKDNLNKISSVDYYKEMRQVVEIQIRLTSYNMYRLSSLNIDITTMPLNKALENLKDAENRFYEGVISHNGMKPTTQLVSSLSLTMLSVRQMSVIPTNTDNGSLAISSSLTIQSFAMASVSYDANKTEYNPKFKDNFAKIEEQFSSILKSLGISDTDENINAAKACSRANLELTDENINASRAILYKINKIKETLHPTVVLNMMKNGLNPLSENIDTVLNYIEQFRDEASEDLSSKTAKLIYEMDKQGVSDIERDSIISFYKMINKIERYSSASVGLVVASDRDVNFKNLFEASQTFAKNKLKYSCYDRKVSMSDGELKAYQSENLLNKIIKPMQEAGLYHEESLTLVAQSGLAYTKDNITIANTLIDNKNGTLSKFYEGVYKHDVLKDILNNPPNSDELSENAKLLDIEKLIADIKSQNATITNIPSRAAEILKTNPALLSLLQNRGMPISLKNIEKLDDLRKDSFHLKNKLNDNLSLFDDFTIDDDAPIEGLTSYVENLMEENPDNQRFDELNDILDTLRCLSRIDGVRSFHIPFRSIDNLFSELNVYVVDENFMEKDSYTAVISIDTPVFKNITGVAEVTGNNINVKLSVNTTTQREDILKAEIGNAVTSMDNLGLNVTVSLVSKEAIPKHDSANIINFLADEHSSFATLV